ncbi:5-formyltetrahydrofolate cyclo-ligase [Rhodobacterales bacterium HKCCSP123]|nr:5-formyltetrahydrofolate cyclo-ligase [Rhodobacterales bacterium HKCCSP123]
MSDVKAALRQTAYAARKAAFAARADTGAVAAATAHLLAEIGPPRGRIVTGYMPIRTELDPLAAMTALHGQGARLAVPVIAGKGQPLDFREWTPGCALTEGPFGAMIPESGDWLTPDTLIVPLVGFDAACNRLGYGGGFYDRTLARLAAQAPTRAIGFAFAAQELPPLPVEPTDIALDAIVTEAGVLRRS